MKRLLLFALLTGASFSQISGTTMLIQDAPEYVIIEDQIILLTANNYMSAQYVRADLLDGSGNVQSTTTTQPGRTITFTRNDASRKVRSTYHMDSGQEYVVVDELSM